MFALLVGPLLNPKPVTGGPPKAPGLTGKRTGGTLLTPTLAGGTGKGGLAPRLPAPSLRTTLWSPNNWAPDDSQWSQVSFPSKTQSPEAGTARAKVVACRPSDWQARTPPVLATFEQLKEALGKEAPSPGNLVVVYKEDLAQLHDLWQAFGDPSGLTAVAVDKCGSKLEGVGLKQVSALHSGPWVQQATKVQIASVPVASKVMVRVTAAWEYRAQFLDSLHSRTLPRLSSSLLPGPLRLRFRICWEVTGSLTTGARVRPWWATYGSGTKLLRRFSLRVEIKVSLFLSSVLPAGLILFWIRAGPGESRESYYLRVLSLKRQRTQPVLFRPAGGHDLGFPRLPQDHDDRWARHFTATGIPRAWDSTDVAHFLKSQNWTQLEQVRQASQLLVFQGSCSGGGQTSWRYIPEGEEAWCIDVCLSTGQRKQAQVTPLSRPRPKLSAPGQDAAPPEPLRTPVQDATTMDLDADTEAPPGEDDSGVVPPSQLDEDAGEAERRGPRSRSPVRPRGAPSLNPPTDPSEAQRSGWRIRDLGGNGDCLFRAVAECLAHQESPSKALREAEAAVARGAMLRSESVAHARKHADRFAQLFASRDLYEAWLAKAPCQNTWAEGKLLQALCERLGAPIVVWSWANSRSAWERFTVAGKFSKGVAICAKHRKPITVTLRDKHYAALKPPEGEDVPAAWLRECVGVVIDLLGAGSDADFHALGLGDATPSLHSASPSVRESPGAARRALGLDERTPSLASVNTSSARVQVASRSGSGQFKAPAPAPFGPLGANTVRPSQNGAARSSSGRAPAEAPEL